MNDQNKKIWKYLWNGYVAVTPVLAFLLLERLYHSLETGYSLQILFGNLIWFYGLMFFAAGLFCKLKYGVITVYVVAAAAGITNYFLLQFRNTVLTLGEFYSIGTAAQVIGNYEFRLPPGKIMLVLCFIILMIPAVIKKEERLPLKKCMIRWGTSVGIAAAFFVGYFHLDYSELFHIRYDSFRIQNTYYANGFALSFISYAQEMIVEKPEGYSKEAAAEILKEYESEENGEKKRPNVIAVMNESFDDLNNVVGFETSEDMMPFYNSLKENTKKGLLYVSTVGGGTCNSEFEFLTGNSMANLPSGSIPYQQYIHGEMEGLTTVLNKQQYETVAIHPGDKNSWNRTSVYHYLDFDRFLTIDDFEKGQEKRTGTYYLTDRSSYNKVIEEYENRQGSTFIFNVTIQNHGGYGGNGLEEKIAVNEMAENYEDVKEFVNLIKISDDALRELVEYYEKETEPVVIVFFGDHGPSLDKAFIDQYLEKPRLEWDFADSQILYQVPFFVWANYDIEEEEDVRMSSNYLSAYMMEAAGLPTDAYQRFLLDLREQVPIMNVLGYQGADGIWYSWEESSPYEEWIRKYEFVQYMRMFDS